MLKELEKRSRKIKSTVRSLNIIFNEHVENYKHPAFDQIMALYQPYKKFGTLPFPGSISEQPSQILDFFGILDSLIYEREERERLKQEREFERSRARGN